LLEAPRRLGILLQADEGDGGAMLRGMAAASIMPGERLVPGGRRILPRLGHAALVVIGLDHRQMLGARHKGREGGAKGEAHHQPPRRPAGSSVPFHRDLYAVDDSPDTSSPSVYSSGTYSPGAAGTPPSRSGVAAAASASSFWPKSSRAFSI